MLFTPIPNIIIDELNLNPYQFQLLIIIFRKNSNNMKKKDGISLSQFHKLVSFCLPKIIFNIKRVRRVKTNQKTTTI